VEKKNKMEMEMKMKEKDCFFCKSLLFIYF